MQKEDCGRMAGFFPFWDKLTGEEQKTICRNAASAEYPKGAFIHRASEDLSLIHILDYYL